MEALFYSEADLKKVDAFQTKALKQIQYLPDRTSNTVTSTLLGIPPISAIVHKNSLNLLYRILQNTNSIEYSIAERRLVIKRPEDQSLFSRGRILLAKYGLPTAYEIIEQQIDQKVWKHNLQLAIYSTEEKFWTDDIQQKPSLKYFNPHSLRVGKVHNSYSSVKCNSRNIQRAEIKSRLLTGTYTLHSNRAAFNQHRVDPDKSFR